MSSDPGFELQPTSNPLPTAEPRSADERPWFWPGLHRAHGHHPIPCAGRLGSRLVVAVRAYPARSRGFGLALRAGHLRGLQSLSPAGRWHRHVPPGCQRPSFQYLRRALGHARAPRRALRGRGGFADLQRARLGAAQSRREPVPASADDRDRGGARRPPREGIPVPAFRLAFGGLLPARREAAHCLAVERVLARGPRRHGRGPNAPATTRRAWSPSNKPSTRAANKSSGSTPSTSASSKRWAA